MILCLGLTIGILEEVAENAPDTIRNRPTVLEAQYRKQRLLPLKARLPYLHELQQHNEENIDFIAG